MGISPGGWCYADLHIRKVTLRLMIRGVPRSPHIDGHIHGTIAVPFGKDGRMVPIRFFGTMRKEDIALNEYVVTNHEELEDVHNLFRCNHICYADLHIRKVTLRLMIRGVPRSPPA